MVRRRHAPSPWAQLLVLTTPGLSLAKLLASLEGTSAFAAHVIQAFEGVKFSHVAVDRHGAPALLLLAGALAMHAHVGVAFLQDSHPSERTLLLLTDLIENAEDLRRQAAAATKKCSGTIAGIAAVCGKEELPDDLDVAMPWFCGWTPKGAKMQVDSLPVVKPRPAKPFELRNCTTSYEGNVMSEDRSDHWTTDDSALFAVYDGHGGDIAVNFVHAKLGGLILDALEARLKRKRDHPVAPTIPEALTSAFLECDELLKAKLRAYGPTISTSKGFCNTGSCVVTALFHGNDLVIANVGDCQAVLGYTTSITSTVEASTLAAKVLTTSHDCHNAAEVKKVIERSNDRNAVRMSKDDRLCIGEYGIKRVAGSLSVTRALGDMYLKSAEFSNPPYKAKVPYITAEPDVVVHTVSKLDKFVILASDGLWEVVPPLLAVQIVSNYVTTAANAGDAPIASASAALVHCALDRAASKEGMALHDLLAIAKGPQRRSIHDDITCTVIFIEHP
ncbi:protein phosphatase 2C [Achlya hypogyna]|uniref:Protein phosphatase 2C n=1 Tax=Achlya hypogyna TaxID=1202772 RepID=A0A1V9YDU4_ACHHY|nr:protein phosphatase 2C [Achlya hypogyna]